MSANKELHPGYSHADDRILERVKLSAHDLSALDDLLSDEQKRILDGMSAQEIRACALYCAMSLYGTDAFWPTVVKFEAYIKGE